MVVEQEIVTLSITKGGGSFVLRQRDSTMSVDLDALKEVFHCFAQLARVVASETTLQNAGYSCFRLGAVAIQIV